MSQLTNLFDDIADAIRLKTGSSAQIVASNFPQEIANIPSGTDTSDATATAGDIGIGKTAYANGVKLTGTNHWNPNVIPPAAGTLTSLVVGQLPDKTIYYYGESPDLYGLTVLGNYSNGFQYDVTGNCTYTVNDPLTYQDTAIVASLDGVSLSIPITVNAYPVPAPDSTFALYHLDTNLKNEVTGNIGTGTFGYIAGHFGGASYRSSEQNFNEAIVTNTEIKTADITIEFWGKRDGTQSNTYAVAIGYISNNSSAYLFGNRAVATYGLELNSGFRSSQTLVYAPPSFRTEDWHHYAVVFTGGTYKTFIDGKVSNTGNVTTGSSSINYLRNIATAMIIDEVMICREAKYSTDFEPPHAAYYLEDFIESTGTQYIDTGFTPNQNSGFEIDFVPLDNTPTSSNAPSVINSGGTGSYGDQNARMVISYYPTTSGATGECQLGNKKVDPRMSKGVRTQLSLRNKVLTYKDGTTASMNTTDFTGYNSLLIFAAHNATVQRFAKVRLFSLKLYDGDTLVRDFVPALVNGTPCLYDKVTDTNYYNSGTGTFTYRVAQQST